MHPGGINYFIDTSALLKRYNLEAGSEVVNELFSSPGKFFISAITPVEVISNLRRLVDVDNLIDEKEFQLLQGVFLRDIAINRLEIVELTPSILVGSLDLCTKQYITPPDALQLSSSLEINEPLIFVCSNKKLLHLASQKGLETLDPTA